MRNDDYDELEFDEVIDRIENQDIGACDLRDTDGDRKISGKYYDDI